ncbi:hypothetical protein Fmac_004974 [Flemingia macrophylla]|uniref:Uncharacterized protein n=1 Tax=Flemingia macrophylla TaxID=520843 RepID=A0ABD1N6G7_9FABA
MPPIVSVLMLAMHQTNLIRNGLELTAPRKLAQEGRIVQVYKEYLVDVGRLKKS